MAVKYQGNYSQRTRIEAMDVKYQGNYIQTARTEAMAVKRLKKAPTRVR